MDPRPVEGGRGNVPLGELGAAALPSPLTLGRSALCQLLASRPVHSRHFRHGAAKTVAHTNTSPAFAHPTHTCLPIPQPLNDRRIMVVADEDVAKLRPASPSFAWIYDITLEQLPVPIATFQVAGLDVDGSPQPPMSGCHQPSERFHGSVIPFAWFAQGLRLVDIADPFVPREVGHFLPHPADGEERPSSNDVTVDDRGLIYLVDRVRGVDIIEARGLH